MPEPVRPAAPPSQGTLSHDTQPDGRPDMLPAFSFLGPPTRLGELGTLGTYRVTKLLGKGGMGFVFRGEDDQLRRPVALKVMRPEVAAQRTAKDRFLREARAAAAVKSDHVVTIHQVGEANGVPFLAMEFLEGCTLEEWLKRRRTPPGVGVVLKVARDVLRGLDAAHERGLVHRDVKPANLWAERATGRVKLLDFGLTRDTGGADQLTSDGAVVGTPAYMAPEQADGRGVDARADVFSVGVVMYRMLAGKSPFQRDALMGTLAALLTDSPPPVDTVAAGVPAAVGAFVARLMAKEPAGRPGSAKAALAELAEVEQAYRASQATSQPDALPAQEPAAASRRPKWWLAAGGLAALLAVAGVIVIKIRNPDGTETEIKVPDGSTVTVERDGKTVAKIGGVNTPVPASDHDRRAAEVLLPYVDYLELLPRESGKTVRVTPGSALPAGPFEVLNIRFADGEKLRADFAGRYLVPTVERLHGVRQIQSLYTRFPVSDDEFDRLAAAPFAPHVSSLTLDVKLGERTAATAKRFANLTGLGYAGDDLDDAALARLADLPRLNHLFLRGLNRRGKVGPAGWAAVAKIPLRGLGLQESVVDGPAARLLAGMELDWLSLKGARLTGDAVGELAAARRIRSLLLPYTNITDADLAKLHGAAGFTRISLSGTRISEDAVRSLSAALPACEIGRTDTDNWLGGKLVPNKKTARSPAEESDSPTPPVEIAQPAPFPPLDPAWLTRVKAMTVADQVKEVGEELKRRNPGFDPAELSVTKARSQMVVGVRIKSLAIRDVSPLRVWDRITQCSINCLGDKPGVFSDLSPLRGYPLEQLDIEGGLLVDLSPLTGMPLRRLQLSSTAVRDLKPLQGMKLDYVNLCATDVTDLAPLAGMPLREVLLHEMNAHDVDYGPLKDSPVERLRVTTRHLSAVEWELLSKLPLKFLGVGSDFTPTRDGDQLKALIEKCPSLTGFGSSILDSPAGTANADGLRAILRGSAKITRINYMPAADYWKGFDAKQATKP